MHFTKMHGLGNCYIYVNCFEERVADAPALARAVSDRNTGVGSDGLILICPSKTADARMEMYNIDGSRGQMCGNGIRCVAKYVYDHGICRNNPLRIETDAGMMSIDLTIRAGKVEMACVDMGPPRLKPEEMPAKLSAAGMRDYPIEVLGRPVKMTCVSMGNPHVVVYDLPLALLTPKVLAAEGSKLENHEFFPHRTNVHFAEVQSAGEVRGVHWERGSGPTAACGTGACAIVVAGAITGRNARKAVVHVPGGDLHIDWRETDNHVYMTGPAVEIFTGNWP